MPGEWKITFCTLFDKEKDEKYFKEGETFQIQICQIQIIQIQLFQFRAFCGFHYQEISHSVIMEHYNYYSQLLPM